MTAFYHPSDVDAKSSRDRQVRWATERRLVHSYGGNHCVDSRYLESTPCLRRHAAYVDRVDRSLGSPRRPIHRLVVSQHEPVLGD